MKFWNFIENPGNEEEIELRIEGDIAMDDDLWALIFGIQTVTPKGFRAELEQHKGKNITVWINSPGGDVYAASQIYTSLQEHKGKVTVKVDGMAMSAASVIAMAGSEVLMSPTSIMMVHNPWGGFMGEAKDLRHAAEILDTVKETIVNAYQLKTKHSRAKIAKMMDDETWMSARTAINEGFANGMLYATPTDANLPIENAFKCSRMAIQNAASESTKRFIEQYNLRAKELSPAVVLPAVNEILDAGRTISAANEQKLVDAKGLITEVLDQIGTNTSNQSEPEPVQTEVPRQAPVDLYIKQISINRRKANV